MPEEPNELKTTFQERTCKLNQQNSNRALYNYAMLLDTGSAMFPSALGHSSKQLPFNIIRPPSLMVVRHT